MDISRKEFCSALGSGSLLLLLQSCGGGGGYGAAPAPPPGACGAAGAAIAGNHGHVLVIPRADLDSAVAVTYGMPGTAGHDHNVTFTPAQLQMLKSGAAVTVSSTVTFGHNHDVTATCT